ncbi:MAG: hypothetical protein GY862_00615, partial [Gammaproteobacteria bacterium]|nr:hypothetical protein [Gammaproteobacteria bacterium]
MNIPPALAYVLRHAWLWPLVFWMRPLQVIYEADQSNQEIRELWCAVLGGALWGLAGGVILEGVRDKRPKIIHADEWLAQGWTLLKPFQEIAAELPEYRRYPDADSRRGFLAHLAGKLKAVRRAYGDRTNGAARPAFWANIGTEIVEHWIAPLKQEAEQAREWLKIEVEIPPQQLRTGHQVLALKVRNRSGVAARRLLLRVTRAEGLHCDKNEVEVNIPLERFQETVLHFT